MRHNTLKNRFGRTTSHRESMVRNMVTNLLKWEKMETTIPKAREIRRHAEKIITLGKRVTLTRLNKANGAEKDKLTAARLHAMRIAGKTVQDKDVLRKVFDELGARYESRNGGYTRLLKLGARLGDGTEMGILELVDRPEKVEQPAKKTKGKDGEKKEKKPRSENRPAKKAAPQQAMPKPTSQVKGSGFDSSRGRGGSRGS